MGTSKHTSNPLGVPTRQDTYLKPNLLRTLTMMLMLSQLLISSTESSAFTNAEKRKGLPIAHLNDGAPTRQLSRAEVERAEGRLAEMGYAPGRVDGVIDDVARKALIAFQKWEGRKVTGRLSREDFEAIMSAGAPQAKDLGYKHVEVDLDR